MKAFIALSLLFLSSFSYATPVQNFEAVNTPISDFVRWFSIESGQTIVLGSGTDQDISVNAVGLTREELAPFFNAVISAHGLKLIQKDGFYSVVLDETVIAPIEPVTAKLYKLQNVRNTKVITLIQSMLNSSLTQVNTDTKKPINKSSVDLLPTTNAIIVTGSQTQITLLDTLIQGIDRNQNQVLVESIITEVQLNDAKEVGLDMSYLTSSGFELISSPIKSFDPLSDSHAIFKGGDFTALVKAIQNSEDTKLLSKPDILIIDREKGHISVGQNVPFLTSTETTDGGKTIQQIERKDVGVSLTVIPHIIGDHVLLQITQESSSVSNSAVASDIITNKRTLQTVIKVQSGQTVTLGGLISTEDRESVSGVPLLMDIPYIGQLFQSTSNEQIQKELKVVIKTTII